MENIETDEDSESIYMNIEDFEKNGKDGKNPDSFYMNTAAQNKGPKLEPCGTPHSRYGVINCNLSLGLNWHFSKGSRGEKEWKCEHVFAGCEAASEGRQVRSGNAAAVGLGLLCFILLAVIVGLSIKHNAEIQQIQNSYTNITLERDQLQTSYTNITLERDQLQTSYTNITLERDQLIERYDGIAHKYEQLLDTNNKLGLQREQLQRIYETVNMEKYALQKKLTEMEAVCPSGWLKFMCSCYYVSPSANTWDWGRHDCRKRGADLVIIKSREEQIFVSGLGKTLWIGLTDKAQEGSWKWVDDTLLGSGYWNHGEPNNINYIYADEDCVQINPLISPFNTQSNWNDVRCSESLSWICEKRISNFS
ncbi:CD209 antigen-like protein B [Astyanax mexicanus]|uniref:CD209 antigen-like protein B n=1 Tax=Astyanax mexicanus TaxID=7994 RepID=UPI0020CADC08|nr:CD209 antigen-like protein B [Astyanax mexicanus]